MGPVTNLPETIRTTLANDLKETTSPAKTTEFPERTTKLAQTTPEFYETTQMNTTIVEQTTAAQTTTLSNIQTTQSILGKPRSCKEIKDSDPSAETGVYEIEIEDRIIELVCDMDIAGGGWNVFQNRFNGETDFAQNWTTYEKGFGKLSAEYWLGLKNIHTLTKEGSHKLRVELSSFDGRNKYAEYDGFRVANASDNYRLTFDYFYSGDAGDALDFHHNMEFSTYDVDNDKDSINCATYWGSYGGNWYDHCTRQNLNGKFGQPGDEGAEFMLWYDFDYNAMALQKSRWMLREVV